MDKSEPSRRLDVLCVADLCVDVILRGGDVRPRFGQVEQLIDDYTIELGGSATIFAAQFAKLGGSAGIIGTLGQDLFGRFAQERLANLGLDTRYVTIDPKVRTGAGFALAEPTDRAILTCLGGIDATGPETLTGELIGNCRHWHIASYFLLNRLRPSWVQWLSRLRAAGVTSSLDPNWCPDDNWKSVRELIPLVDVFLANENEVRAITECDDWAKAGMTLSTGGPIVAIKRGANGATAFYRGQRWDSPVPVPVSPDRIVDTIGAGDCFDAGFIRAWKLGKPVDQCLELAIRCGQASLGAAGGFTGQLCEEIG
ncbi:MAG: carbohydrate kinase family protein [Phycisphaerales bacterium]|jgi:sugar/nucleoside kinase (ribokinase family)|nr:carbohydrate kinase family protein [Phycisphaerales bacterium]